MELLTAVKNVSTTGLPGVIVTKLFSSSPTLQLNKLDSLSLPLLYRLVQNIIARAGAIELATLKGAPLHSRILGSYSQKFV
jgi:hypothetical protein